MQYDGLNFVDRLKLFLIQDRLNVTTLLGITGIFLGLGFFFNTATNYNYELIELLMPYWAWGIVFTAYGSHKLYENFYRTSYWRKAVSSVVGMWAWAYVFLSFTIFDWTPTAPTEYLLMIPMLCEVWSLSMSTYRKGTCEKQRRKTDAN